MAELKSWNIPTQPQNAEDRGPSSPTPEYLLKRRETYVCTQDCTGTFTAVVFIIGPNWKQPQMSFNWLQVNALQ